jgi:transposase
MRFFSQSNAWVHAANAHDTVAGSEVFKKALKKYPRLKGVCADMGYRKTFEGFVTKVLEKIVKISQRTTPGWAVLRKSWVVERTFSWLKNSQRLSKVYEISTKSAENIIIIAHSQILLKRLV